jgi:hypothetical protein
MFKFDNYNDMTNGTSFFGLMTALRNHELDWTEVYDTRKIVDDADLSGNPRLFVDIGGAHGLDTQRLLSR